MCLDYISNHTKTKVKLGGKMYLIEDEALNKILDGEFYQVIVAKHHDPKISMLKLFRGFQFDYKSYLGFINFYKKRLLPVVDQIKIIDDKSLLGKLLRLVVKCDVITKKS